MEAVLLVIHLIVAISIIVLVMVQPADAGGFMGGGGGNAMMPRRSADFMTRLTTIMAGVFFVTSLLLAINASHRPEKKGVLDLAAEPLPVTAPAIPATPVIPDTAE